MNVEDMFDSSRLNSIFMSKFFVCLFVFSLLFSDNSLPARRQAISRTIVDLLFICPMKSAFQLNLGWNEPLLVLR